MINRYPCQVVILFIFGILLSKGMQNGGLLLSVTSVLAAAVIAGLCVHRESLRKKKLRQAAILLLAFLTGAARMHLVSKEMRDRTAGISDGQKATLQGRITQKQAKQAEDGNISWTVRLADSYLKTSQDIYYCGNSILYTNLKSVEPVIGNIIIISGKIKFFREARNDGNFDERAYYHNQGYAFQMYADQNTYQVADDSRNTLQEILYGWRQRLIQVYQSHMPTEEAGVLCAMLTGEKSLLSEEIKQLYRKSGIAHILAISGLHISILGAAVFRLLRARRISYIMSSAVSLGLLVLFGIMTGYGLSTFRAVVMFAMYLGASCCGRAYDSMTGLAVAAACILLQNPCSLFLAGFQFSFLAVAGVLLGKEICQICMPKYQLAETIVISLSMQMLTLPLTAWYYFEVPIYALLLNLFVIPFMGMVLILGLFGGVFGLHAAGGVLSETMLSICTLVLKYFSKAGEWCLSFPGAVCVTGQPKVWQMAVYYLILAGSVMLAISIRQTVRRRDCHFKQRIQNCKKIVGFGYLACLTVLSAPLPMRQEVVVLDVGQGDGIYIRTSDGSNVMIDGGSTDIRQVGTYRILPFLKSQGIAKIDCWFLSHLDQDHTSGFLEIVQSGYPVEEVVLAGETVQDQAYESMMKQLSECQIKIRHLEKGDTLRSLKSCFYCLSPASGQISNDRNANSLTLLYEDSGYRGFFSGDISKKEERRLLQEQKGKKVSFYKAAHHGSDSSNAQELLEALKPSVSVISCAEANDYGHPGKEAAAVIETHSGITKYTMRSGQIRVAFLKDGLKVTERCKPRRREQRQ